MATPRLTPDNSGTPQGLSAQVFGVQRHPVESARIAEVYSAVRPSLCRYLRRKNLALEEIDDVVQEAFVRLLSQRSLWDDNSSMRFWLFRVVRNLAIDRHRSVFRRYGTSLQADSSLSPNPPATSNSTPEDDCLRNERWFLIEENLSKLTVRQRYAIGLWMQGLTYHEIGLALAASTHTVEELLRRGFNRLREAVRTSAR